MVISEGYFYHISDSYFQEVNETTLMSNKENGGYRPHYLAVKDASNPDIFWMIPVPSRYEKFTAIYQKQVEKYKRCTKIVLGKCGGWDAAYLIQNAFPITADYFDHIHTSQGQPLTLHTTTARTIVNNLNNNLRLHKRGVNLFFADIDRLCQMMLDHLASSQPSASESKCESDEIGSEDVQKRIGIAKGKMNITGNLDADNEEIADSLTDGSL